MGKLINAFYTAVFFTLIVFLHVLWLILNILSWTWLRFQLKQEQENRRNSEIMYNTTRDKLRRTEEQHQLDLQDKQQVELTLRNLELEMRTLISDMKRVCLIVSVHMWWTVFPFWALVKKALCLTFVSQLEEEHSETQRLLTQERSARTLQENLLNGHLRRQQEMEEENKRSMSRSNEVCLGFSYKMHRFFKMYLFKWTS